MAMAARRHCSSSLWLSPLSSLFLPRGDLLALIFILSLLLHHLTLSTVSAADSHFEGFDADDETLDDDSLHLIDLPLRSPTPPTITQSDTTESDHGLPDQTPFLTDLDIAPKPSTSSFEYWDEDKFEGLSVQHQPLETTNLTDLESDSDSKTKKTVKNTTNVQRSYIVEIACEWFLIIFVINYFSSKKDNENLALAWATKFATKDSIFDKNFSLLGGR
ncbi:Uncharacterized protein LOK49_LG03G03192 [Camellia lanceoleosa]|uniref:Uncharacterized protein n=1 Tax=Camellia lanceoleosa TaxID=1840588 RepID=A0ACC0I9B9_9ERIC|nr:Uncharacterized protein LOK49_LG03G03192 [Camellia lanceoleosa]